MWQGYGWSWCFHFVPTQQWRYTTQVYATHCTWVPQQFDFSFAPCPLQRHQDILVKVTTWRGESMSGGLGPQQMTTWLVCGSWLDWEIEFNWLSMTQAVGNVQGNLHTFGSSPKLRPWSSKVRWAIEHHASLPRASAFGQKMPQKKSCLICTSTVLPCSSWTVQKKKANWAANYSKIFKESQIRSPWTKEVDTSLPPIRQLSMPRF